MGQRLCFDLLTADAAAQSADEETKGSVAHPSVSFTSAAASLGVFCILMPPGPEVACLSVSQAEEGRTGTTDFVFFLADTRCLATL